MGNASCKCGESVPKSILKQEEEVGEILPQIAAFPISEEWDSFKSQGRSANLDSISKVSPWDTRDQDASDDLDSISETLPQFTLGPTTLDHRIEVEGDQLLIELLHEIDTKEFDSDEEEPAFCTLSQQDKTVGIHICPAIGTKSVDYFVEQDKLGKMFELYGEELQKVFSLDKASIKNTHKGRNGGFACAVADPLGTDCPLVYVSQGFEDLTGYTSTFAVGRSCRFLQPTSKLLNDALNREERMLLREFCSEPQPVGTTLVSLLLNQRFTGERFWNLLRMQYMEIEGDVYIFAVQTNLDAYMPKVLQKPVKAPAKNGRIVGAIDDFIEALSRMRKEMRAMGATPIMQLKGYFTASLNSLEMLPLISTAMAGTIIEKPIGAMAIPAKPKRRVARRIPGRQGSLLELVETIKYPFSTPGSLDDDPLQPLKQLVQRFSVLDGVVNSKNHAKSVRFSGTDDVLEIPAISSRKSIARSGSLEYLGIPEYESLLTASGG